MPNPSVNGKLISYNVVCWKDVNPYFAWKATSVGNTAVKAALKTCIFIF